MSNTNNKYVNKIKSVFGNLSDLTPEKLQGFVGETMILLSNLRTQFESNDPKVREEGIKAAQDLKDALTLQFESMAKLVGENPADLMALIKGMNPATTALKK